MIANYGMNPTEPGAHTLGHSLVLTASTLTEWQWSIEHHLDSTAAFQSVVLTLFMIRDCTDSILSVLPNELMFLLLEWLPAEPYAARTM